MMFGTFAAFITILCSISIVNGDFTLTFQFHEYSNPGRRDFKGDCCDPCWWPFNRGCDTYFSALCVRVRGTDQCIYEPGMTGNIGGDDIQFGNTIGRLGNPFSYSGSVISQSGYQLYVRIMDDDINADDLIDEITIDIPPSPPLQVTSQAVTGNHDIVSLTLSYSLLCDQHYYGSDCSVNCVPHNDDINGHYTCNNVTGSIECRDGWQNPINNCREVDCRLICDSDGGRCVNGSCECNPGWSGEECGIPQCSLGCHPQGGYCNTPNQCLCNNNWDGTNCSISLCTVNCSSIGGSCPTPNICNCSEGYTGESCEIDMLPCKHQFPCLNGANCSHTVDIGGYNCSCLPGYTGINCQTDIDECGVGPCYNNGTCLNGDPGSFRCICSIGWTGDTCNNTIDYCESNPCINNGTCHNLMDTHYCQCPMMYEGLNCELERNACIPNPCLNNATCINLYNNYTCICTDNSTAYNCDDEIINSTIAMTHQMVGITISAVVVPLFVLLMIIIIIVITVAMKKHIRKGEVNTTANHTVEGVDNITYTAEPIPDKSFPKDYEEPLKSYNNTLEPSTYEVPVDVESQDVALKSVVNCIYEEEEETSQPLYEILPSTPNHYYITNNKQ